jgi:hypothetical protein
MKCPIEWQGIYETTFSIVDYWAHQVLGNVESQIEIEKIFLKQAYYKPKGMSFIIKKIYKISFCEKNCQNDPRFDCKSCWKKNLYVFLQFLIYF